MIFSEQEKREWAEAGSNGWPNKTYTGKLVKGWFKVIEKNGSKKLCLKYEVSPGKEYTHYLNIDTPTQMFFTKKTLELIGADPHVEIDEVEAEIEKQIGRVVEFELFQNGKYQNCRVIGSTDPQTMSHYKQDLRASQQMSSGVPF